MTKTKKTRNKIDGVLLLDKSKGLSSNQAIQKVRRILNAEKAGHTGTLDPMATGLLPVCLGEATKFAAYALDGDKEYIATAQLGVTTDSGDSEGNIVAAKAVYSSLSEIKAVLENFVGEIKQIPPMYSALKYNGRPLYEYARQGIILERKERIVHIYLLELINFDMDKKQIVFRARVSKGTYIRTLAEDIGNFLGCGASLTALRRTQTNQFNIQDAMDLEGLAGLAETQNLELLPCDSLVTHLPRYDLDQQQFAVVKYGNMLPVERVEPALQDTEFRLYINNTFLGIGCFITRSVVVSDQKQGFSEENDLPTADQVYLKPKRLLSGLADI